MMRFGTILTLSLAVAAGIGLFYAKHRVQALEDELAGLQQQIIADREAIHVLRAEWSFLNDPDRLAELSRRHLELAPIAGSQLATIEDIPEKLPLLPAPETPPGGEAAPEADPAPPAAAQMVEAEPAPPAPAEPVTVVEAPAKPVQPAPAPAKPAPEPAFADLPADVQAVLASMRSAE